MARTTIKTNYLTGATPTSFITTDAATRAAATEGGSGGGGYATTVTGAGPDGIDCWDFEVIAASGQKTLTMDISQKIDRQVGIWINAFEYPNIKKVSLLITSLNFTSYFAHDITLTDIQSDGWVFITRQLSQFANQGGGLESWDNVMTKLRIVATADAAAAANSHIRVADVFCNLSTQPQVLFFFDDSNDTDLTEAAAYMTPLGLKGISSTIVADIGNTGNLTAANLVTLQDTHGWDIICHHADEFDVMTQKQQYEILKEAKNYLHSLGLSKASDWVAYPGGVFNTLTKPALREAGFKGGRSTVQLAYSPAYNPDLDYLYARGTSAGASTTAAGLLAALDDSIKERSTHATFSHGIYVGATGIHTDKTVFQDYCDGVALRVNKGLVSNPTLSQWYNGLNAIRPLAT